ncbi:MAG: ACT domain-containing protein [Roseiarcus sp.]|jgi:glycine cleavage system regulatory protein
MTTPIVLTFIGHDRPGLVNAISEKVAACGATWLESRLARLAGEFAGIVLVAVPEAEIGALTAALRDLETAGLRIAVERSSDVKPDRDHKTFELEVVGHERPGIVREVTQALTQLGVNIEEFSSNLEGAPFSGAAMFRAAARLRAPDDLSGDDLRRTLERIAHEITVDIVVIESDRQA